MRPLIASLTLASLVAWAAPASAAGVGLSLPKFRSLSVGADATSFGGSVQVVGTSFSIGLASFDLGLDYAFTRNFAAAANYSFFDLGLGVGVPLGITPQVYVKPALDGHALLFVASPENLGTPTVGVGPSLTVGYKPNATMAVELGAGYALLPGLSAAGRPAAGGLFTVELGGTVRF